MLTRFVKQNNCKHKNSICGLKKLELKKVEFKLRVLGEIHFNLLDKRILNNELSCGQFWNIMFY